MSEQRDKQLLVVYTVVVVVVLYYAVTYWLPFIQQSVALYTEKSRVLQSIEGEIKSDEFDVKELAEYKSKKSNLKQESSKKSHVISPNFVLENNLVERSAHPPEPVVPTMKRVIPNKATAPKFRLPVHAASSSSVTTTPEHGCVKNSAASASSTRNNTVASSSSTAQSTSQPSRFLGAFAQDSIEAQLHQSLARRADPFGIEHLGFDPDQLEREAQEETLRLLQERELREQQDREYQQSLQRDLSTQKHEDEAKLLEERIAARSQELTQLVKAEPELAEAGCITLSFRSRQAIPSSVTSSTSTGGNTTNMRIQRRFLSSQHTAEDLLHFVESLELRPLLSAAAHSCVLTLDFPTRIVSQDTDKSKSLAELGIETDSVIWVRFDDE